MSNSIHRFSELAFKYLKGELDADEVKELDDYLAASEDNRLFFERLTSKESLNEKLDKVFAVDHEAMWKNIVSATPKLQRGRLFTIRPTLKYAAAVILIAALGTYIYLGRSKKAELTKVAPQAVPASIDIMPGGNKAILTLSGGQKIVLDSAANGNLATQGQTAILKTADGQITYNTQNKGNAAAVYYNTVSTPKGGQYQLTLSDGSKVWMNAASTLHFPTAFTGTQRQVELDGEAYFEVAKNAMSPFVVKVKDGAAIKVLGTHFNIMAYGDEQYTKTTLVEGSVRVTNGNSNVKLQPGQQALSETGNSKAPVIVNKYPNIEEVLAWKNGVFQFANADLRLVMRQVARWYDVDVVFDNRVPEVHFTGRISRSLEVSELLSGIEYVGVHFKIDGKKILVLP